MNDGFQQLRKRSTSVVQGEVPATCAAMAYANAGPLQYELGANGCVHAKTSEISLRFDSAAIHALNTWGQIGTSDEESVPESREKTGKLSWLTGTMVLLEEIECFVAKDIGRLSCIHGSDVFA